MRQLLATLLLLTFSFPLSLPFLSLQAEANLPACCRRDGSHKCRMRAQAEAAASQTGVAIKAGWKPCSQYPGTIAVRTTNRDGSIAVIWRFDLSPIYQGAVAFSKSEQPRLIRGGPVHKRGPPSLRFT